MNKNYRVAATLVLVLLGQIVSAQEPPVDLSGIWWSGAPVPLLPGETAPPAMGMGMGGGMGSSSPLMLTAHGTDLMADFDPADDPAVVCVQSGLARAITSPYPLEIVQSGDTATIEYEEWEVLRTIHIGGSVPDDYEPNSLGYSIGQYEEGTLIVTSTGATEGLARIGDFFRTSEEMTTVERYSLTERGQLSLDLEIIDPLMLSEPLRWERTWNPYDQPLLDFDCILRER